MEFEQIIKKLEWLDEERRRDKATIAELQNRLAHTEGSLDAINKKLKDAEKRVSELSTTAARINQFDDNLVKHRTDISIMIEKIDERVKRRDQDAQKNFNDEINAVKTTIADVRKGFDVIPPIQKDVKARIEEENRLGRDILDLSRRFDQVVESSDAVKRTQRINDEDRRQDMKRIADLAGEIAALRKRIDEHRDKTDMNADNLRLLDGRINELLASETDRRQTQTAFIEQQSRSQVERDKTWKEMASTYQDFAKQASSLDAQLQALDNTHRAVKRAQETHEELNQKLERRINEITEMQRLAEDRMRQEWVTFKADDQKRWTSLTLSQEEQSKDVREALRKLTEQITELGDQIQTQKDLFDQTSEASEKQLQELMNWAHEWLTAYERITGKPGAR